MPLDPYTRQVHTKEWQKMISKAERISSYLAGFRKALNQSYVPGEDVDGKITFTKVVNDKQVENLQVVVTFRVINNKGAYNLFAAVNGIHGNKKNRIERWISVDEDPISALNELVTKFPAQYRKYFNKGSAQVPAYGHLEPFRKIYNKIKSII